MDFQQTDYGNSDGFYNTNYDQSYGFDGNQQQYGGYDQGYNQQYAPSPQQPQVFSPSFPPEPKGHGPGGSGFEDEPPLLEGMYMCIYSILKYLMQLSTGFGCYMDRAIKFVN